MRAKRIICDTYFFLPVRNQQKLCLIQQTLEEFCSNEVTNTS